MRSPALVRLPHDSLAGCVAIDMGSDLVVVLLSASILAYGVVALAEHWWVSGLVAVTYWKEFIMSR